MPDSTGRIGAVPQAMTSSFSMTGPAPPRWRSEIGGAHRKAVDIGAVERRHVNRRHDILRQRAAEQVRERPLLARDGPRKQRRFETLKRVFAREDGQELVLIGAVGAFWQVRIAHVGPISVPQNISINRRSRSKTFAASRHREAAIGAGDGLERHLADRKRHPGAIISFEQDDFGDADA